MNSFYYYSPTKIIFGNGESTKIASHLKGIYKKALLVVSKGPFRENGTIIRLTNSLSKAGIKIVQMNDIDSNPRLSSVKEGIKICCDKDVDCVIALGGGSAMDCAKVIASCVKTGTDPYQLVWGENNEASDSLDLITIPTIAATGTEVNPYAVIVHDDTKEKYYCVTPHPKMAILDPELTLSVPKKLTCWGSMDILSHAFEFYFNGNLESESQMRLSEAIIMSTMCATEKLMCDPKDVAARGELMWNAVMSWGGLTKIGRGEPDMACHGLEESFSGYFDTHHGACLGVLTPRWMDIASEKEPVAFARFGRNVLNVDITNEGKAAKSAVKKYKDWLKSIGAPNTYFDIGDKEFSDSELHHVAKTACKIYGGSVGKIVAFDEIGSFELLKKGKEEY